MDIFGHGKIITKIWKFEVKVIISRQFYFEISGIRLEGGIFKLPTNLLKTWETLNQPLSRVPLASKWRKAAKFVNFEPSLTTKYFFKNGKIITKILNFEAKVIIFRQLYFEISGIWLEGGISNLPPKSPESLGKPKQPHSRSLIHIANSHTHQLEMLIFNDSNYPPYQKPKNLKMIGEEIKIASLNVNGINNFSKRNRLFHLFNDKERHKFDIILVQETKLDL